MGIHHGTEAKEERRRIVRTGAGLGMELDREEGLGHVDDALVAAVVGLRRVRVSRRGRGPLVDGVAAAWSREDAIDASSSSFSALSHSR